MTKKDFQLIADAIKATREDWGHHDRISIPILLDSVSRNIGYALSKTNERFDLARFLKACGVTTT